MSEYVIEQIAQQWDGCKFDAPGETIDIGDAIRRAGKRLLAAAAPREPAPYHWQQRLADIEGRIEPSERELEGLHDDREPAPDERVQHSEWGPMPDAETQADTPFVPFYQLLQSPDVWVDIDQETFIEMKGFNCRVLYGVKP